MQREGTGNTEGLEIEKTEFVLHHWGMTSVSPTPSSLPSVVIQCSDVFPDRGADEFMRIDSWEFPVTYFVGRNGSGKSRTARALASKLEGRHLATDRLTAITKLTDYGWGMIPAEFKGVPIDDNSRGQAKKMSLESGGATEEIYVLKEQPEVGLKVAAFIRRAFGRTVELRESAGFIDPYVQIGDLEYSLLRDEGHGLRELVVLLTATYRTDTELLVVDEPELHLHPSVVRLWLTELNRGGGISGRRGVVVTHEPTLLMPRMSSDLNAIWLFAEGRLPIRIGDQVLAAQQTRVSASLSENPELLSQLAFSPRPVLVEGPHDVAALSVAMARTQAPEITAQTDFVSCGGSGGVGLWLEIAKKLHLDVKAVADLDACLSHDVQRVMDAIPQVEQAYRQEFTIEPARTAEVLKPLISAADQASQQPNPKVRAKWFAESLDPDCGHSLRLMKLFHIWRDAGLWLHSKGTLEDVLSIQEKGIVPARVAASIAGPIDEVAAWCSYELDSHGELESLLNLAVERIAHTLMEAMRASPSATFTKPVGPTALSDARLVRVNATHPGGYRLTVERPEQFAGYWLEFSRDTPSSSLVLAPPPKVTPAIPDETAV